MKLRIRAALAGLSLALSVALGAFPPASFIFAYLLLDVMTRIPSDPKSKRIAFSMGLLSGSVTLATVFYWLVPLLRDFAHLPTSVGILVLCIFSLAHGLVLAVPAALVRHFIQRYNVGDTVALTLYVVTFSLAFDLLPSLFPWQPAISLVGFLPLAQLGDIGGPLLLDLMVFATAALALHAQRSGRRGLWLAPAGLLAVVVAYGLIRIEQIDVAREGSRQLRVGVVQPNVGILEKHDPALSEQHLVRLHGATTSLERRGADIILWPETAFPYAMTRTPSTEELLRFRPPGSSVAILGGTITLGTDRCARYNSAVAVAADGTLLGIVDKVELLAFGETVPLWHVLPPLRSRFACPGLRAGAEARAVPIAGAKIGVLNCYEDVLPEHARKVAQHSDLLVNVTNDAWFGDTTEPYLHDLVARHRAIEARRDLVRAVNTGISSFIDANGRELHATETYTETTFLVEPRLLSGRSVYSALPEHFFRFVCLGVALLLVWRARRESILRSRRPDEADAKLKTEIVT